MKQSNFFVHERVHYEGKIAHCYIKNSSLFTSDVSERKVPRPTEYNGLEEN